MNANEAVRQLDIPLARRHESISYIVLDKLVDPEPIDHNLYRLTACFKYGETRSKRTEYYYLRWDEQLQMWNYDCSTTNLEIEKQHFRKRPWKNIGVYNE